MTPRRICVVNENQSANFHSADINYRCSRGDHRHWGRSAVERRVHDGAMAWVGKHKRVAVWLTNRSWKKVYNRNRAGEVISCGMQLVKGG